MPKDPAPGGGPFPLSPDTDESPPTEEVLDGVVTEETEVVEPLEASDEDTDVGVSPTQDWFDPDAGEVQSLSLVRQLLPWVVLLGAIVLFFGALVGLGLITLPGMAGAGGKATCERTCQNLGTTVLRYDNEGCVCRKNADLHD